MAALICSTEAKGRPSETRHPRLTDSQVAPICSTEANAGPGLEMHPLPILLSAGWVPIYYQNGICMRKSEDHHLQFYIQSDAHGQFVLTIIRPDQI